MIFNIDCFPSFSRTIWKKSEPDNDSYTSSPQSMTKAAHEREIQLNSIDKMVLNFSAVSAQSQSPNIMQFLKMCCLWQNKVR